MTVLILSGHHSTEILGIVRILRRMASETEGHVVISWKKAFRLFLFFVVITTMPASAIAQSVVDDLRKEFRQAASDSKLGNAFQALAVFAATPGISAATYHVDGHGEGDMDIKSYKLTDPPSFTFEPIYGVKPYIEGTIGYLDIDRPVNFSLDPAGPTRAELDIGTLALLGGLGAEIDIAEGTVIRPVFHLGYTRIWDNSSFSGPLAEEVAEAGDGILFDVYINSLLFGASVGIEHTRQLFEDTTFVGKIRYNQFVDHAFSASDPVLETTGTFGILTSAIELDGPTGWALFGRKARWIGFVGNTYLPGEMGDDLGFNYFFELGGGIQLLDSNIMSGVDGISLRGSTIFGKDVTGWMIGLSLDF